MTTLVLGATGATGQLVVEQLLQSQQKVVALIRPGKRLEVADSLQSNLSIVEGEIDSMSIEQLAEVMKNCHNAVCCLGHNLSLKGLFGQPRKLVSNAVQKLQQASDMLDLEVPFKVVLMSSTGVRNGRDLPFKPASRAVVCTLRCLLPPHKDNELASAQLQVSKSDKLQWVSVRPDSLIDCSVVSPYSLFETHQRDPIFASGESSRINVANFMAQLVCDAKLWSKWQGKNPILYNR